MQRLLQAWVLLAVLSGHASLQAAPPDERHEVQLGPGRTLKLWFSPKYGWRAKSYDHRYPGCTRQQKHRVYTAYTADEVVLGMLKNPKNLHWLSDPEEAGQEALYIGQLGLAGGMPPSKRVKNQAKKDLSAIAVQAIKKDKMDDLQRALGQAQEHADFDGVYEQVFGAGSSEGADLAIFDLTVGEVRELANYKEVVSSSDAEDRMVDVGQEILVDAREVNTAVMRPAELVRGLYSPVDSEKHQVACKLLRSKKYEAVYSKVLPLTAGLLYKQYVTGKDRAAYGLHVFWRCLLSDPRELIGIHQVVLNMRCMEACRSDARGVLAKLHKPILDDITSWVLAALDVRFDVYRDWHGKIIYACTLPVPLLPVLEDAWGGCPHVLSYRLLVEGVLSKLRRWGRLVEQPKEAALETLTRLLSGAWPHPVRQAVLDCVLASCEHRSSRVRQAAGGLSKALQRACSEEGWKAIVEVLAGLCKDADSDVRCAAVRVLSEGLEGGCSEEGWEAIVGILKSLCGDEDGDVRRAAAEGLFEGLEGVHLEEGWKGIVEALKGLCKDTDSDVRRAAAGGLSKALEGMCSEESWKAIVQVLAGLCRSTDRNVRRAAAERLSEGLEGARSEEGWKIIVEVLTDLCKDGDGDVRRAAAEGLSEGLEGVCSEEGWKVIVEDLSGLCKDREWRVRKAAAEGLSEALGSKFSEKNYKGVVETLTSLCGDRDYSVRHAAAGGLSKGLGTCSEQGRKGALEALTGLCKASNSGVRKAAAWGLSKALEGACSKEGWKVVIEALTGLCKDGSGWVRSGAAEALPKGLGGKCSREGWKVIIEALKGLCKDEDEEVRRAAAEGLSESLEGASGQGWQGVVEDLTSLCKDEDEDVRRAAAEGLSKAVEGASGEPAQGVVEALTSLCEDEDEDVRRTAAEGLSVVLEGACSEEVWQGVVEALIGLCRDEHWEVRHAAAQACSQGLEGACSEKVWKGIVKALKVLCKDNSEWVRQAAVGLSKGLETQYSERAWQGIMEALNGLCRDSSRWVRRTADQALVQAMGKQELLARVLMGSRSLWSALLKAMAAYNACLTLPEQCDLKASGRIQEALAQERQKRGWPEDLLGIHNLPSVPVLGLQPLHMLPVKPGGPKLTGAAKLLT